MKRHLIRYFFLQRNFTDQGKLTEATGLVEDDGYLGQIQAWNDKPEWGLWRKGSDCDKARYSEEQNLSQSKN